MILKINHCGLRVFWETDSRKYLNARLVPRIHRMLIALDIARCPEDLNLPGFRLHSLGGQYQEFYSLSVSRNWRIIFRFVGKNVIDIQLIDYH
jgi:toxin HigB-1